MKRLSKADIKRRDKLIADLESAKEQAESAVEEFNGKINEIFVPVREAIEKYNEILASAEEWRSDIYGLLDQYYDDRSANWQDGEAGQEYAAWRDEWGEELEPAEMIDSPDMIDIPDMDHADVIQDWRKAPE